MAEVSVHDPSGKKLNAVERTIRFSKGEIHAELTVSHDIGVKALVDLNTPSQSTPALAHRAKARQRRLARHNSQGVVAPFSSRKIPAYAILNEAELKRIEDQADWILERTGVEFHGNPAALDLFAQASPPVSGDRISFAPGQVRAPYETAPKPFQC